MSTPKHIPIGDPCASCGKAAGSHKADHTCTSETCTLCGLQSSRHRKRKTIKNHVKPITYLGIDGEGQGREDHRYVLLGVNDEHGTIPQYLESLPSGHLSTKECLDFILSLPTYRTKIFSYSFNYDLTKILTDLDNKSLYLLARPELRARPGPDAAKGPYPVKWKGYRLNLQGTKFSVSKDGKRVVIWDIFKFYGSKFVSACVDWKVGSPEAIAHMSLMKDKRSEFDKESPDKVRAYCLEECQFIAELARKLVEAHESADLKLTSFYGAGSSGAAMLNAMGVRERICPPPIQMHDAIASAFFGGRFENSVIGAVKEEVWNYDISSAYPYQCTFLPCLVHGHWSKTLRRVDIERATVALVRYSLGAVSGYTDWGPFPFRTADGSISFPIKSGGGWVWKDEYLQGEKLFPHVKFEEAWCYQCSCDCKPFSKIPEYYTLRLKIGKEGPGIVIKLGVNSVYGKLAQSVGNAVFNSWIWAGLITSGCRAQILEMMGLHHDRSNLLMVATDGIYSRERLSTPPPRNTGTGHTGKPLGGWEEKRVEKGLFLARPGIYFPLNPTTKELKDIRGRGVGKGVVFENWEIIQKTWERDGLAGVAKVANVSRFCGLKTSIHKSSKGYTRANGKNPAPAYGQWINREVSLKFDPKPKRECVNPDGLTLKLMEFPSDLMSIPYKNAMLSKESLELRMAELEMSEQPDGDMVLYE